MPAPKNISRIKSFLASVQFYSKFLPRYFQKSPSFCASLHAKDNNGSRVKKLHLSKRLNSCFAQTHYDPSLPLGLSCDTSEYGIRFADRRKRASNSKYFKDLICDIKTLQPDSKRSTIISICLAEISPVSLRS